MPEVLGKKFIVYLASGSHSDYGISGVMVGDVDPVPLLSEWVRKASLGQLVYGKGSVCHPDQFSCPSSEYWELDKLRCRLNAGQKDVLIAAGFVEVEAVEVWLGE